MKKSVSTSLTVSYNMKAGDLAKALEKVPAHAKVSVHITKGDRWESDYYSIHFNWEEEL